MWVTAVKPSAHIAAPNTNSKTANTLTVAIDRRVTRTLVIAPQWIGDAVMTEPLMRRLAKQGHKLTVAALPWVAPVYRCIEGITQVIELPFQHGGLQWAQRRDWGRRLQGQFDAAYVLPNSFKSALIPFFAGIPQRVGYHGEARWGLLNHRLPNPGKKERPPMVAFYSALADVLGPGEGLALQSPNDAPAQASQTAKGAEAMPAHPVLRIEPGQVAAAQAQFGLAEKGYVVFAPGAEFGPAKRWPLGHFAALARSLALPVVLLGSGKEAALCQSIAEAGGLATALGAVGESIDQGCLNLAGKTDLAEALALISGAAAVVSNDSGLMHVAASLGVPQVAVFGSSSPLHTPPLNMQARVLWLKSDPNYQPALDCAPCFQRECPLGHTRCLQHITPALVLQQLTQLLPHLAPQASQAPSNA
jgi:heptosyltransferase-2